jgi:hypothetical protein
MKEIHMFCIRHYSAFTHVVCFVETGYYFLVQTESSCNVLCLRINLQILLLYLEFRNI